MELPPFLAEAACARLRDDYSPAKLRRILNLLELDLAEPGPEPDYEDLASKMRFETPENERRGCVHFTAEMSVLGYSHTLYLRYAYVAEYGEYPDAFEGFDMLGSVGQLDLLTWSFDGRTAEWSKVNFEIIANRAIIDAVDELVLEQVRGQSD